MAGELRATVLTTVKGEAVEKLRKDLGGLSDSLKGIGGVVGNVAKGFAGFASAIGATKFVNASIEQAKLLEQTYRSLETVFGPLTGEMQKFAEGATKIGLSQTEAAKASIFIGGVLQQYGVSTEKAAESTQRLVSLAADLSFVYGYDVQEALLGMTALFRGEYDPIEKFGVAMKQNEIESIKAARGLGNLTGAAEMNADVLIRQELLFQRTGKSLGAFTDNADSLAVQSEVMRATFENLQATIGQQLTPVITQFFSDLIPIIEDAGPGLIRIFEIVAEVLKELAATFIDIFDPTTKLGESVSALIVQFDELGKTIFGKNFAFIGGVFDVARYFVDLFVRALTDVLYMIQSIVVEVQAWGKYINAILTGDWDTVAKGIQNVSKELHAAKDAAIGAGKAMAKFMQAEQVASGFASLPDVWNLVGSGAKDAGNQAGLDFGDGFGEGAGKGAKDAVAEFYKGLQVEIEKQSARMRLESMGASEGLISAILGSGEQWQKVFNNVLARGQASLQKAQALFNRTAAGIKELEAASEKAAEAATRRAMWEADAYQRQLDRIAPIIEANNKLIEQQNELASAFRTSREEIFANYFEATRAEETLGEYTSAVVELGDALNQLIEDNPFTGETGLFSNAAQRNLIDSTNGIIAQMRYIAEQRDELGSRTEQAKSLIESISDSIFGSFNITSVQGRAKDIISVFRDTVKRTKEFADQLAQLRASGLNQTALEQIISAGADAGSQTAKALIQGGPKAIAEVNSLFGQLGDVSKRIGQDVAVSMYGNGVDMTNGLIEGLLSQQSALEAAANQLGNAFRQAFTGATESAAFNLTAPGLFQLLGDFPLPYGTTGTTPVSRGSGTYNITVNAGLGANGQNIGQIIIDEIKKFERQSGRVFVSA